MVASNLLDAGDVPKKVIQKVITVFKQQENDGRITDFLQDEDNSIVSSHRPDVVKKWQLGSGETLKKMIHKPLAGRIMRLRNTSIANLGHSANATILDLQKKTNTTIVGGDHLVELKGGIVSCKKDVIHYHYDNERVEIPTGHEHIFSMIPTNNHCVATAGYGEIKIWDVNEAKCLTTLLGHRSIIWQVLALTNGQLVSSGMIDGKVKLWCLGKDEKDAHSIDMPKDINDDQLQTFELLELADSRVAVNCARPHCIKVWDPQSSDKNAVTTLSDTTCIGDTLLKLPDGTIASLKDNTIGIWDVKRGVLQHRFRHHKKEPVRNLQVLNDGRLAWSSGSEIVACDVKSLQLVAQSE